MNINLQSAISEMYASKLSQFSSNELFPNDMAKITLRLN